MTGRGRPRYPFSVRARVWSRRLLPAVGFAAAVAGIVALLEVRSGPGTLIGLADETPIRASSGVAGRLTAVLVGVHQDVQAGDVVATLEDTTARLEIDASTLVVAGLRAELDAALYRLEIEEAERDNDVLQIRRRLELDRLDARVRRIEEQARLATDAAILLGLEAELARVSELAGDFITQRRFDDSRAERDAVSARMTGREATIEAWRAAEAHAETRLAELSPARDDETERLVRPLATSIAAAETRLEQARVAAERFVIRAPSAGRVAAILQRPGEEVVIEEPIVTIAAVATTTATAWLREEHFTLASIGTEVEVRRASQATQVGLGRIVSIGPAVTEVPAHALRDPAVREFGLPITVRMPAALALTPGERVSMRLVTRPSLGS